MTDLATNLCGLKLRTPLVLASGPLSFDGDALVRAHRAGAGAVVTKTIGVHAAVNPVPHIARSSGGLLNAERWSDLPPERWIEREIPRARKAGAVVIASVGLTREDVRALAAALAEAGASALEVVSYDGPAVPGMVEEATSRVSIPVFAKVSANGPDVVEMARACLANGASAITAIDSVGPALRFDLASRRPRLGGYGWLSGRPILPVALRVVADIARETGCPIVGTGGVETADDAVEMLYAGANAVGVCTAPLLRGVSVFGDLVRDLSARLFSLGFESPGEATGAGLSELVRASNGTKAREGWRFAWSRETCTDCGACVRVCPYGARRNPEEIVEPDCRGCGLCSSSCPTGALLLREEGRPRPREGGSAMRRTSPYARGPCVGGDGPARRSGGIIEGNDTRPGKEGDGHAVQ
ncbi:MAG: 4Fe-4S binding protein [Candidatus Bipolaricaulota bacterium]|nr:4Fe-4S binding protein [Candidatus Bipolaricaulota bacterium]